MWNKFNKWVKTLFYVKEEINFKMVLKSRDMGNGKYEVGGVVFNANSHAHALKKYRRALKEHTNE